MLKPRSVLLASVCLLPAVLTPGVFGPGKLLAATPTAGQSQGGTVAGITVTGNARIEPETIQSYMVIQPGDPFDADKINNSLKTLYATGLFKNVSITRKGNYLVVAVEENPTVDQVYFVGNKTVTDKDAAAAIGLKPRSVFTVAAAEADRRVLLNLYAKKGYYGATVTPNIIKLPDNRVNVVFQCTDGTETLISRITFLGNDHFSQGALREVVSSRQEAWFRFLSSSDQYDSERVQYDEELLRQFYLHHGYADFQVNSANAELSPDRKSFYLTFNVTEGPRYKISSLTVASSIRNLSGDTLRKLVPESVGDWFDGAALQEGIAAVSKRAQDLGYAFAQVTPVVKTDPAKKTLSITLNVVEGPKVYIQRIDIIGNTRTEDKVIRRELTLAEGDGYSQTKVDQSQTNLKNLGFFKDEKITTTPGSTPQQVILDAKVTEQATGQFSLGGGYSTSLGALVNAGLSQNNFLGTGVNASINALLAQRGTQINLGVTDPYFLDRNLIAGFDIFRTVTDSYTASAAAFNYSESDVGADVRMGYRFNAHVRQSFTYTISERNVYGVPTGSSLYIIDEKGVSTLSQISQSLTFDYLDDDLSPTSGALVTLTTDFAGLGGTAKYIRLTPNISYYIPLERVFGSKDWVLKLSAGAGYLLPIMNYQDRIVDRFFLGGDTLRGFADGGVGPHDKTSGDSLGGKYMYTQSTELHFPLPVSHDLGLQGFAFVDVGSLYGVQAKYGPVYDSPTPRVGAGVGVSFNTPFGLINLSLAEPILKQKADQVQQFRVSFGTRF
ncbi:MAG: outer membrane protein assembly factor BamA [Rhodospirillales bacterium 20-64-7]|nr:MAG: outer membrane protein assembly factor BamA [Rhodospirillales bacterium 20-64-7]